MTDQERKEDLVRLLEEAGLHENAKEARTKEGIPPHVYEAAKDYIKAAHRITEIHNDPNLSGQQKIDGMKSVAAEVAKKYELFLAICEQGGFNN